MSITTGNNASLFLDGYSLTGFAKSFQVDPTIDVHDATPFGTTSRVKATGLRHATASGELFYDDTSNTGSYDVLKSKYGAATPGVISFFPQGHTLGNRSCQMYAHELAFTPRQVVDDLIMLTLNLEASEDALDFGVVLHALGAETGTANSTSVDNAASTANGGVMNAHVTAIAGGAPSITIVTQHSTDNSTWADLATSAAITAANSVSRIEVAAGTTVNRYLRSRVVFGGTTTSVTFVMAFARR